MRFVLIHGGFHGAWCWRQTVAELENLGHEAIAIDLPGHGSRRDERSTIADRREAIVSMMLPRDVLVGHSGGGYDITFAADEAPEKVGHLVYLAAGLPAEGKTVLEVIGGAGRAAGDGTTSVTRLTSSKLSQMVRPNATGRLECVDPAGARDYFYQDCDDETAAWALSQLTPAPVEFLTETVCLPRFWQAELPRSYILCRDDRALRFAECMAFAGRLGVTPLLMDGSHSPFLSRPAELARMLVHATTTEPVAPLRP